MKEGKPGRELPLRSFEKNLKILERQGKGFWKSEYQSVQNLLDHLSRGVGSELSRDSYLRTLDQFCREKGLNPDELVALGEEKAESLVQNFADNIFQEGYTRSRTNNVITNLTTFYKSNGYKSFKVDRYYKQRRKTPDSEHVPSNEEIHKMAGATETDRNKSIVYFLWTTGLRVSTLAALNYEDIRGDLKKGKKFPKISVKPELKERLAGACKENIPYHTFVHPLAVRPLQSYLREREEKYGPIEDGYPLFHSNSQRYKGGEKTRRRLGPGGIGNIVKKSAEKAELDRWKEISPTSLRKAYKSVLRSPTVGGETLPVEVQEFLMGHILPERLEEYYDRGDIERHREIYSKLDFREKRGTPEVSRHTDEDKIVGPEELQPHLNRGWKFIEKVGEEMFVIRRESTRKDNEKDMRFFLSTRRYLKK